MKISQTIAFMGLAGLFLAGLLAPTIYATEDGQFSVFPTIVDGDAANTANATSTGETIISPASPVQAQKTTIIKTETTKVRKVERNDNLVTNETGVFSPWGTVKRAIFSSARAEGEGVILTVEAVDAKLTSKGDLRHQIFYANNTGETLRNVSIQVFLPKNFQYLDSDLKPDSKGNGTVVYDLDKVAAGESGAIQLEIRSKKKVKDAFISATMVYQDIDDGAHTANATASNAFTGSSGGGRLSASILDGAGDIMLWFFVIILIIALAFVAYQLLVMKASSQPRM